MTEEPTARIPGRVRLGAVIALGLAVAFVAWLLVRGNDSSNRAQTSTTAAVTVSTAAQTVLSPEVADPARLQAVQASVGHPIYWAGVQHGKTAEVRVTKEGWVYVRYLPAGVQAGDAHEFLTVATYPVADAYGRVKAEAGTAGEQTLQVPGGGLAVYSPGRPTNVYVAYPGIGYQVEVYDQSSQEARALVTAGKISPVG